MKTKHLVIVTDITLKGVKSSIKWLRRVYGNRSIKLKTAALYGNGNWIQVIEM